MQTPENNYKYFKHNHAVVKTICDFVDYVNLSIIVVWSFTWTRRVVICQKNSVELMVVYCAKSVFVCFRVLIFAIVYDE